MSWMFPPTGEQRDAIELSGSDLKALPEPSKVTVYRAYKEPLVQLYVDGQPRRAAALERHDVDGRILFRLGLWPRRRGRDALRVGWFWADTDAMRFTSLDKHPVEAAEHPGMPYSWGGTLVKTAAPLPTSRSCPTDLTGRGRSRYAWQGNGTVHSQ